MTERRRSPRLANKSAPRYNGIPARKDKSSDSEYEEDDHFEVSKEGYVPSLWLHSNKWKNKSFLLLSHRAHYTYSFLQEAKGKSMLAWQFSRYLKATHPHPIHHNRPRKS